MTTWPDIEGAMRTFLRQDASLAQAISNRVFFSIPDRGASFPLVTVRRVGGGDTTSEAPVDSALIEVQVWGNVKNKVEATSVLNVVRDALSSIRGQEVNGTRLYGASVNAVVYSPDPDTSASRYIVTAVVTGIQVA